MTQDIPALVTTLDARSYFRDQLATSLFKQQVCVTENAVAYLVNLLLAFMDSRRLFTPGTDGLEIRPLAFQYADAVQADGLQQRNLALKKLGDVALFVAGIFSGSLARKLVDVDYYIAMGGAAYRDLHAILIGRCEAEASGGLFGELAAKFPALVDVLSEVSEESHLGQSHDVLRSYEIWLKTGSGQALKKLQRLGLRPSVHAVSVARH